jgi:hypothetical protein
LRAEFERPRAQLLVVECQRWRKKEGSGQREFIRNAGGTGVELICALAYVITQQLLEAAVSTFTIDYDNHEEQL